MRVVLTVHHFPPRYSAGAELYTFRLARWLLTHGHEVEVVCVESVRWDGRNQVAATHDRYQDVPVWRLEVEASPEGWPARTFDNPELAAWFAGYLAQTRPDLAHFQAGYLIGVGPLRAAAAARVPTILTLHDFWFLCPRITLLRGDDTLCDGPPSDPGACAWCMRLGGRAARLADRLSGGRASQMSTAVLRSEVMGMAARRGALLPALAWPDAVVAPSHFLAERFRPYVPADRLRVVHLGIDVARLRATPPAPDDGTLRLAYVGQIAAHKGVHVLVEALRALPKAGRPVELTVYGDLEQYGDYGQRLRAMAASDARIHFAGRFDHARITEVLGACDATVTPSIWYENSPLSIMEAHAAGRPVLTSALGGMAELVGDEVDGLHFKPGDVADLARQIQRLREEPALLQRLRLGVRPPATIDEEMATLLELYRRVTRPHSLSMAEVDQ
ncbi:MAG: glycosyltransferase family 4 protein [Chloroflexales bacterium]|nr:glycosyltransferase family 4 protein [Chloroflexales bacterium]